MSMEKQITNRLHRSGACDFNCSYDVTRAQENKANIGDNDNRRIFKRSTHDHEDSFSVCEGEPLFTVRKKGKFAETPNDRFNMPVMSSVNCTNLEALDIRGNNKLLKILYEAPPEKEVRIFDMLKQASKRMGVHHGAALNIPELNHLAPALRDDVMNAMLLHSIRESFFGQYRPIGVSVSKWIFKMLGRQGNEFVATLGGLNTIYVDTDVQCGDTLIVDMPFEEDFAENTDIMRAYKECQAGKSRICRDYGFYPVHYKKGTPQGKKTLIFRRMPQFAGCIHDKYLRQGFVNRGQVIGMCVKSAAKGERCDIVLASNAIGMRNNKDQPHAIMI